VQSGRIEAVAGDDLDRYGERIGLPGLSARKPSDDLLADVHFAHATTIPFENLDIHLGIPIRIEPERVFDKLVTRKRGGYCFEQNTLLLTMLRALGFKARPLAARVAYGGGPLRPRTHMVLLVQCGRTKLLADVGFGAHNLLGPLPFAACGHESAVHGETYRVTHENEVEVRAYGDAERWEPLYTVSLEDQQPVDFAMGNWFTSTHPSSVFVRSKIVSAVAVGKRTVLLDRELKIRESASVVTRTLEDDEAYLTTLRDTFGIALPEGSLLRW
jgi:N-hydroxyarylamine O-acetyltransferase